MKKKNIHAIILARGGSKGIKNKNLISIKKKPLIYWSIKSALNCNIIDKVWVSSDSSKILTLSKKFGANTIKRPKKLSSDNSSSESGWLHSTNYIKKKFQVDYIVAVQATSPMRHKNDFFRALNKFFKEKNDSLFSSSINDSYFRWKIYNNKMFPNYKIKDKRARRQYIKQELIENGSFYIFKSKGFLKNKKRLFGKIGTYIQKKYYSFELDDQDDLVIIKSIMKYLG
ncbi:acylneuraminate cytidylyltransferase family protein [bacterium]|jgi:CMP-N,N'-diacetyllegionaminic acid synthase|nr:acylneuraminate cytidylyltransferase family protein [bacterium]